MYQGTNKRTWQNYIEIKTNPSQALRPPLLAYQQLLPSFSFTFELAAFHCLTPSCQWNLQLGSILTCYMNLNILFIFLFYLSRVQLLVVWSHLKFVTMFLGSLEISNSSSSWVSDISLSSAVPTAPVTCVLMTIHDIPGNISLLTANLRIPDVYWNAWFRGALGPLVQYIWVVEFPPTSFSSNAFGLKLQYYPLGLHFSYIPVVCFLCCLLINIPLDPTSVVISQMFSFGVIPYCSSHSNSCTFVFAFFCPYVLEKLKLLPWG